MQTRREFLLLAAATGLGISAPRTFAAGKEPLFRISLAEWSLHRRLFDGKLDHLDFPALARNEFGIEAVEYVNQFFMDKATDKAYLAELKKRCDDHGVRSVLIMCDREGNLGDPDPAARTKAVENHYKWVEAAAYLGCHSIRVNAASSGSYQEQHDYAVDGLRRLSQFAAGHKLGVIVENHGGLSSNGGWLSSVLRNVGQPNIGSLPDFGNFRISQTEEYDRYQGVTEMMPFARGVSAKSYGFDAAGNETLIDYARMLRIVLAAGYHGHVGIEWEGNDPPDEAAGVRLTKALLERLRDELAKEFG